MDADFFDEQAEKLLGLLWAFVGEDLVEFVSEVGEGGRVRGRVRLCGEAGGEVGFLFAERLQTLTVAADAFLAESC